MNLKNVLLLGSTSFTGSHILFNLNDSYSFKRVGRDSDLVDVLFDVEKHTIDSLSNEFEWADVVINCLSNGDVDSCEKNPKASTVLNLSFPIELCKKAKLYNFHLIHFSSNAVYDGDQPVYTELSEHLPLNTYGRLKSEADLYLKKELDKCTVLRPITMYGQLLGKQRHNPFSYFFDQLLSNKNIVAVNDVYVNMLHVDILVQCVAKVIDENIYDEFNISGDDIVNRFEFVSEIKRYLPNSTSCIEQTDSSKFITVARRPLDTSFDNSKMKSVLGVYPKQLSPTIEALVQEALLQRQSAEVTKNVA